MKKMTKNFKQFLFVIVLLCVNSNLFGNDSKPSLKLLNSERMIVTLNADNIKKTPLTIRIFDEQGFNLLNENVAIGNQVSKAYDFSKLPKGVYKVEIENHTSIRKYIVTTTSKNLSIVEKSEMEIYKPVVRLKDEFVEFNMLNLNLGKVRLIITNNFDEEIFNENIKNTSTIHRRYDLSKLPSGQYSVIVNTQEKVFNFAVNLN